MSYVVLARKYRPRSFAQMVGQEHVVQALTNALQTQRLHHAYLFTGTRGIGKTTVSRILAKSLNCTGADGTGSITAQPCGVCQACTEIDADRYLDYIEMDAASNGGKDEIKDLIERAAYKPGIGRFKVFMIDEAHQLSKDAFNALLKTLEEPPEYLKFVLATTDPDKVLPTVLSRCLQFNLRPMAPATVHAHLQRVLADEGVPSDDASLRLLAKAARGSMRDGLSLTDQAIAYGGGALTEPVVRAMLGSVDRGHVKALVQALAQRDGVAVLATIDGLRGLGLSAAGTLEDMALLLQQMAVEQAVPGALDATDPDTEDARELAGALQPDETQLLYVMALQGRQELSLMSDEYGALTMVLLRFLAFPAAELAGAGSGVVAGPGSSAGSGAETAATAAAPTKAPVTGAVPAPPVGAKPGVTPVPGRASTPTPGPARAAPLRAPAPPAMTLQVAPPLAATVAGPFVAPVAAPLAAPVAAPFAAAPTSTTPTAATAPSAVNAALPVPAGAAWPATPPTKAIIAAEPAVPGLGRLVETADPVARIAPAAQGAQITQITPSASTPPVAPMTPVTPVTPTDSALAERWYRAVKPLCERGVLTALARELAMQAGLRAIDASTTPPTWRLVVERETLRTAALRDKLMAALAGELGEAVQIEIEAGLPADSPARRDTAERQRRQAGAEAAMQDDPLVRQLLGQFKTARIVPGSVKPV